MVEEQQELFPPLHYSLQRRRLMRKFPTNPERVYAAEWFQWNRRSGGWRLLEHVLDPSTEGPQWHHSWRSPPVVTRRDAVVAASVVQWLGTNVGRGFVDACERKIAKSYERDRLQDPARQVDEARQNVRDAMYMQCRDYTEKLDRLARTLAAMKQKAQQEYETARRALEIEMELVTQRPRTRRGIEL